MFCCDLLFSQTCRTKRTDRNSQKDTEREGEIPFTPLFYFILVTWWNPCILRFGCGTSLAIGIAGAVALSSGRWGWWGIGSCYGCFECYREEVILGSDKQHRYIGSWIVRDLRCSPGNAGGWVRGTIINSKKMAEPFWFWKATQLESSRFGDAGGKADCADSFVFFAWPIALATGRYRHSSCHSR